MEHTKGGQYEFALSHASRHPVGSVTFLVRDLLTPFCPFYQHHYTSLYQRKTVPQSDPIGWFIHQWMAGGAWQHETIDRMLQHHLTEQDYLQHAMGIRNGILSWLGDFRKFHTVLAEHVMFPLVRYSKRMSMGTLNPSDCNLGIVGTVIDNGGPQFLITSQRPVAVAAWTEQIPHVFDRAVANIRSAGYKAWDGMPIKDYRANWFATGGIAKAVKVLSLGFGGAVEGVTDIEGDGRYIKTVGVPNIWDKAAMQQGMQQFREACSYCPARGQCNPNAPKVNP